MTQLEFFTALANGAKWGVPASISRSGSANGGLPIDAYSIFKSKADAELYASQNKTAVEAAGMVNNAYVGQIITVWESNKVKDVDPETNAEIERVVDTVEVFYIDADKTLKPVGIVPSGDGKTIEVTADGMISLAGITGATVGQIPRKAEDGSIEWVSLETVVAAIPEITITNDEEAAVPTEATVNVYKDLTVDGTTKHTLKEELVQVATAKGVADALEAAKDYTDEEIAGIEVIIDKKSFGEGESAVEKECIILKNKAGTEIAYADAAKFIQDSFLDDVKYEDGKIKFTWLMGDGSTKTDEVAVSDFVQTYTQGTGITITNNVVSIDTNVVATSSALSSVLDIAEAAQTAGEVSTAITNALAAYTTSSDLQDALDGKQDEITSVTIKHTDATSSNESFTLSNGSLAIVIDAYTKAETYTKNEVNTAISSKITEMSGGESAGEVLGALNDYKLATDTEIYGAEFVAAHTDESGKYTPDYTEASRIDALAVTVSTNSSNIAVNSSRIEGLAGAISTNSSNIAVLSTNLNNLSDLIGATGSSTNSLAYRIGQLETTSSNHALDYSTLNGKVNTINTVTIPALTQGIADAEANAEAYASNQIAALSTNISSNYITKTDSSNAISSAIAALEISKYITSTQSSNDIKAAIETLSTNIANTYITSTQSSNDIAAAIEALSSEINIGDYITSSTANNTFAKIGDAYTKSEADAEFMTEEEVDARIDALILASDPANGKVISNIQNLVKYVDENAGQIVGLISTVSTNSSNITALQALASSNSSNIGELQEAVSTNSSDIDALQTAVSTNSSNIAVIETAISSTIPAAIATASSNVLTEVSTKYVTADAENNLSLNGQTIVLYGGNAGVSGEDAE
jgi:hypothetical protein